MEGPAVAIGIAEGKLQDLVHDSVIQHHDGAVVTTHTNRERDRERELARGIAPVSRVDTKAAATLDKT